MTPAEFKAALPEFAGASDALVQSRLTAAEERTPLEIWGAKQEQGILYLTAHLLSMLPEAKTMAKDSDGKSYYTRERERLEVIVSSGFRVTGRT